MPSFVRRSYLGKKSPEELKAMLEARSLRVDGHRVWMLAPTSWRGLDNVHVIRNGDEKVSLKRLAHELYIGPPPSYAQVFSTCGNNDCWEPTHLATREIRGVSIEKRLRGIR